MKNTENNSAAESQDEVNNINPTTDKGNYLIQIISDGRAIKEVAALNATINIISLGDTPAAFDLR
jgi:hypothetical protein